MATLRSIEVNYALSLYKSASEDQRKLLSQYAQGTGLTPYDVAMELPGVFLTAVQCSEYYVKVELVRECEKRFAELQQG